MINLSDIKIGYCLSSESYNEKDLYPNEFSIVGHSWNERKIKEFIMGRIAGHRAMKSLIDKVHFIDKREDGAPIWGCGLKGSISHKNEIGIAVVSNNNHIKGIGIDIEKEKQLSIDECHLVLTDEEYDYVIDKKIDPTLLFSIKESVFKANSCLSISKMIDFKSINIFNFIKERYCYWVIELKGLKYFLVIATV